MPHKDLDFETDLNDEQRELMKKVFEELKIWDRHHITPDQLTLNNLLETHVAQITILNLLIDKGVITAEEEITMYLKVKLDCLQEAREQILPEILRARLGVPTMLIPKDGHKH